MKTENEEAAFLEDRRFIVGEREILQLIKKSICEQCSELIDEHTRRGKDCSKYKIHTQMQSKYKCN